MTDASSAAYGVRRDALEHYFDRTALEAWTQLTSDAPVSGIRATVRAGRDRMRELLLSWLPQDMRASALFDAGCGTGALSVAAARRGARVVGVDVSASLIKLARQRAPDHLAANALDFAVGDMFDPRFGRFDYVVAMDSLIHYPVNDIIRVLGAFAGRTSKSILFTFAPRTPALSLMHAAGRLFPRSNRAPAIEPASETALRNAIAAAPEFNGWRIKLSERVSSGFYVSQAMQLMRA